MGKRQERKRERARREREAKAAKKLATTSTGPTTPNNVPQPIEPVSPTPKRKTWELWLTGAVTTVGVLSGLMTFRPQLEVSKTNGLNVSDPLKIEFEIKNAGVLPVSKAQAVCEFREVRFGSGIRMGKLGMRHYSPYFPSIGRGDVAPIACPVEYMFGTHLPTLAFADVQIGIEYRYLWLLPLHYQARFVTTVKHDGSLTWVRQPVVK